MNILITGITGRIGANIAKFFLDKGHNVTGFVWVKDKQSEKMSLIGAKIIEGDLSNFEDVVSAFKDQEIIFHLGAAFQSGGPFSPNQYFDINVKGTFNILESALRYKNEIKHLIITSSDATVFKYPPNGIENPIKEDSLPQNISDWYGYSKILTENISNRFFSAEKLPITIIRFAMVWGAGEILNFNQFYTSHFMDQFSQYKDLKSKSIFRKLNNLLRESKELIIVCDKNGRPWKKHVMDIRDIIQAFEKIIGVKKTFGETYQIAGKSPFTWDEVIPYIGLKINKNHCRVELPINPTFYEFDLSKAFNDFNYLPEWDAKMMINDAVRFSETEKGSIIPTVYETN
ncbi:MAG TPA: NAD(P)-dependent oxidoreductase [Dehalococcoidia bacterium]|jgi:nucleoside-diphosphate-sugar epimerase|nr:NAD(P)-dependent oxidoreductase [SAR202 cluster bacterium]HJN59376.1 NAD(P)-dependent oxidoreductase [Dehalococcoidia bacterium]